MIRPVIRLPPPIFQVGHLERLPLGTPYPAIVDHVGRLLTKLPGHPELVIDFTGVGRPVFDMFVYSGIYPIGVVITGGTTETRDGRTCSVPKLDLVSRLQALLHEARLKILHQIVVLAGARIERHVTGRGVFHTEILQLSDQCLFSHWPSPCGGPMAAAWGARDTSNGCAGRQLAGRRASSTTS